MRKCVRCNIDKDESEFFVHSRPGTLHYICKECSRKRMKDSRDKAKYEALVFYSNSDPPKCICCGDFHVEFLALNHNVALPEKRANGIGRRKAGAFLAAELKSKGWPGGYTVLCHNCNMSQGFFGYCPHERE